MSSSPSSSEETFDEAGGAPDGGQRKKRRNPDGEDAGKSAADASGGQLILGDCAVCSHPAHGIHFGVLSCRACAAFYRRSIVLSKNYSCRRANKNCSISKEERYLCRFCRFNKCIDVGMRDDNVQWNRDKTQSEKVKDISQLTAPTQPSTSAPKRSEPFLLSSTAGTRSAFERRAVDPQDKPVESFPSVTFVRAPDVEKQKLDITGIIARVRHIFMTSPVLTHLGVRMTLMQRMMVGLQHLRRLQNRQPEIVPRMDMQDCQRCWEQQMYNIAEWAMYSEEFAELPPDQKLEIFKASWGSFHRLERVHTTIEIFGQRLLDEADNGKMLFVISENFAVDYMSTTFDISFITDYTWDYIRGMFKPFMLRLFEEVARPMIELAVSDYELVFMLCQLVWHLEGRKVADETLKMADVFRARVSNELHDYYMYERKLPNYAARLMRLMGIVNDIENIQHERSKVLELARIFDVFKIDITDPGTMGTSRAPFFFF